MKKYVVGMAVCFSDNSWEAVCVELDIPRQDETDPTDGEFIEYFQDVYEGNPEKKHVAIGLLWWDSTLEEENEE